MNTFVALLALFAVLVAVSGQNPQGGPHESQGGPHEHESQGGPHQSQGRFRRQAEDTPAEEDLEKAANWTTCDVTTTPRISCHDCTTRLVCKPIGGLLIVCKNPFRPHCNNGTCSAVPSAECA